jgi:hypothetical protein
VGYSSRIGKCCFKCLTIVPCCTICM